MSDADAVAAQALAHGLACHQQGRLSAARTAYEQVLARAPRHAQAMHLLGVVAAQSGQPALAVGWITRALAIQPNLAAAHSDLGLAQMALRQPEAAMASYDRALALSPERVDTLFNRGNAQLALGHIDAAVASFDQALRLQPGHADAACHRAHALLAGQHLDEALASCELALRSQPGHAPAWQLRSQVLQALGRLDAALASLEHAIRLQPQHAPSHLQRGKLLQRLGLHDSALACYEHAVALDPDNLDARMHRGHVLLAAERPLEAAAAYGELIARHPDHADAHYLRANALLLATRTEQALAGYAVALKLQPGRAEVAWNQALALLLDGQYPAGWAQYESRWQLGDPKLRRRPFPQPQWRGDAALAGRTVLLHAEQGLGDTLQFCRYARAVADRGARVILEVPTLLKPLLSGLDGTVQVLAGGEPLPGFDLHCPLMSLPLAFGTTLASIPGAGAYLHADAARVAQWAARLGPRTGPRIGLVWSGNPANGNDRRRSIALAEVLAHWPAGLGAVCLQTELRDADLACLVRHPQIQQPQIRDFVDTAALCMLMDVVITVDTSVAHLAAALGRPTWVLLPHSPDWRWLLGRDDSPWYASARLYRQGPDRSWAPVLERVAGDLRTL